MVNNKKQTGSMNIKAVITGDIVKSGRIQDADIVPLLNSLKETFKEINKKLLNGGGAFEIFRGDSFQGLIPKPELALLVSFIIRARLRSYAPSKSITDKLIKKPILNAYTDARIAIGIGEVSYQNDPIQESHGEAFEKSGRALDALKPDNERIAIVTPWNDINSELTVECKLVDAIISRWTSSTAEAMYYYLLIDKNQQVLAKILKIKQPSVHKRLVMYGNAPGIQAFLERYQDLISKAR